MKSIITTLLLTLFITTAFAQDPHFLIPLDSMAEFSIPDDAADAEVWTIQYDRSTQKASLIEIHDDGSISDDAIGVWDFEENRMIWVTPVSIPYSESKPCFITFAHHSADSTTVDLVTRKGLMLTRGTITQFDSELVTTIEPGYPQFYSFEIQDNGEQIDVISIEVDINDILFLEFAERSSLDYSNIKGN